MFSFPITAICCSTYSTWWLHKITKRGHTHTESFQQQMKFEEHINNIITQIFKWKSNLFWISWEQVQQRLTLLQSVFASCTLPLSHLEPHPVKGHGSWSDTAALCPQLFSPGKHHHDHSICKLSVINYLLGCIHQINDPCFLGTLQIQMKTNVHSTWFPIFWTQCNVKSKMNLYMYNIYIWTISECLLPDKHHLSLTL